MDDKRRQKWEAGARGFLEPGEQVVAAAPGQNAERMWPIPFFVDSIGLPLLQRARGRLSEYRCRLAGLRHFSVWLEISFRVSAASCC